MSHGLLLISVINRECSTGVYPEEARKLTLSPPRARCWVTLEDGLCRPWVEIMVADEWIDRSSDMHACLRYLNGINQFIYHNPVELDPSSIKKITFVNCAIWRSEFNITQY